jgi:hypothetical protein
MADEPADKKEHIQRSLEDLIEAARRLREKAKENAAEAERIMATVKKLDRAFKQHASED